MRQSLPIIAVLAAVLLNVIGAIVLKEVSGEENASLFFVSIAIGIVVLLNGVRFFVWGYAHKHYPISKSYPLSTLFFPMILVVSVYYGGTLEWQQIVGTALIVGGVLKISFQKDIEK